MVKVTGTIEVRIRNEIIRAKSRVTRELDIMSQVMRRHIEMSGTHVTQLTWLRGTWRDYVDSMMLMHARDCWVMSASRVRQQLADAFGVQAAATTILVPELTLDQADAFLRDARRELLVIGDILFERVDRSLREADNDETRYQLSDRIAQAIRDATPEADIIAQSVVRAAFVRGALRQMMTVSGADIKKTWVTRHDDVVRRHHQEVDGVTIDLRSMFEVGGQYMDGPYDPRASSAETRSCRCVLMYEVEPQSNYALAASANNGTGAMVALIPADPDRLYIADGEPANKLHLTLKYLGKAADLPVDIEERIVNAITGEIDVQGTDAIIGNAFGVACWNPTSEEPSWVLSVGDSEYSTTCLNEVHRVIEEALARVDGLMGIPQHTPWVPHVCLAYGMHFQQQFNEMLTRIGQITFNKIRVVVGESFTDIPLQIVR